tara:strand:+ start:20751 stop:21338 length:588 start_codon:yes stop_codon:yes gene_type:complete
MSLLEKVNEHFSNSIQTKINTADLLPNKITKAAEILINSLLDGKKVLTCGNGGSCGDAQHFSSELLNRYNQERPALPAIALCADAPTITAIANDYSYQDIFSKQIEALGQAGDVLFAITTSGNSANILNAVRVAHDKNLKVIALTGKNGGDLAGVLDAELDVEIRVPSDITAHIQESHITIIHCLCELIDYQLFS